MSIPRFFTALAILVASNVLAIVSDVAATGEVDPVRGYAIVRIPDGFGVIVHGNRVGRSFDLDDGEYEGAWTPSHEDVLRAEELIREVRPATVARPPDGDIEEAVSRQYFGLTRGGVRFIYVNAAFSRGLPNDPTRRIEVLDGGPGFWRATINADTWEVESYVENGVA